MLYITHMTKSDTKRMVGLDREIRDLIAHEGIGSPIVAELLTEQEALLMLWLAEAEAKHDAHIQANRLGGRV
jgi:hypothetical protein